MEPRYRISQIEMGDYSDHVYSKEGTLEELKNYYRPDLQKAINISGNNNINLDCKTIDQLVLTLNEAFKVIDTSEKTHFTLEFI